MKLVAAAASPNVHALRDVLGRIGPHEARADPDEPISCQRKPGVEHLGLAVRGGEEWARLRQGGPQRAHVSHKTGGERGTLQRLLERWQRTLGCCMNLTETCAWENIRGH